MDSDDALLVDALLAMQLNVLASRQDENPKYYRFSNDTSIGNEGFVILFGPDGSHDNLAQSGNGQNRLILDICMNGGQMLTNSKIVVTGVVGLTGALLTGAGEFILHYDPLARFAENQFFLGISDQRSTLGHFLAVLGAPLYLVGCWHLHLMLRPANRQWSLIAFFVAAYGFVVGLVWIGSRASISALINAPVSPELTHLIGLYDFRYETLLQVIRFTVLFLSVIYIWLIATGRTNYPKWMMIANPILLLVSNFVIYLISPALGKYLMPIALNVAFSILFILSTAIAYKRGV